MNDVPADIPSLKRKRHEYDTNTIQRWPDPSASHVVASSIMINQDRLTSREEEIVEAHFRFVHPWISILHEPSFRNEIRHPKGKQKLRLIVHALTVVALSFVRTNEQPLDHDLVLEQATYARNEIMRTALDDVCIENVQALLILVFSDITTDNAVTAHSLLGIVWRHLGVLGLHKQEGVSGVFGLSHKSPNASCWIEEEERRRVFWTAFMLDRLCTALLGLKPTFPDIATSLLLPVCSSFWYTNQPRPTPRLRLPDQSTVGLNHSIPISNSVNDECMPGATISGVGALAFYVETTESMSLVMTHFLSLEVDFASKIQVSRWLMRFKELDQYLTQYVSCGLFRC